MSFKYKLIYSTCLRSLPKKEKFISQYNVYRKTISKTFTIKLKFPFKFD